MVNTADDFLKKLLKLEQQVARLKNLIKNIPGCVYWKNIKGTYLGCNQFFVEMTGLGSVEEVIGKTDNDLCWKDQAQMLRANDLEVITSKKPIVSEETVVLASGEKFTYTATKSPLLDSDGNIIGVIGTSMDITYRKEMEEELRRSKTVAETANYIKTEFIANMGHDLATPISDVWTIALSMNEYSDEYPELKELFDMLLERAEACEKVRKSIINATDISNLEVQPETFSIIKELLILEKEIREELRDDIDSKNLKIIIHPFKPKKEDLIETDKSKFGEILSALLSNGIKFTEKGQVTVSVLKQEGLFHIKVTDTGIGIPADKYDYIFEQYTKLSRSNRYGANFKGVGAGLYLARLRAKILNATISVESEVNKGSTFTFSIPSHPAKNS